MIGKLSPPDENTVSPEKRSPEETKKLIERQIQLLKESTDKIRRTMNLRRLLSIGPSVIPYLKQELAQADDSTTTIFLQAICSFKDEIPALKPTLLKLLKSDDLKLKRQVVATLKYINDSTVIEALINLATDKNPSIRGEAISSLGYLKRPESIETIILALADNEKEVREKSIGALWEITQTSFKFTPHASESIRKQEIKVIQRWWDANKKKYLQ
ncbi:MAG: HEAT repeat domain-containing protein [Planctomycetes bacterium]|nr:HEAT repeat domain-containing protein [Planctomycetota bacterium]